MVAPVRVTVKVPVLSGASAAVASVAATLTPGRAATSSLVMVTVALLGVPTVCQAAFVAG